MLDKLSLRYSNVQEAFGMSRKLLLCSLMIAAFAVLAIMPAAAQDTLKIGMLLVGPKNDGGWSSGAL